MAQSPNSGSGDSLLAIYQALHARSGPGLRLLVGVLLSPKEDFRRADFLDDPMVDGWVGLLVDDDIRSEAPQLKAGIQPPPLAVSPRFHLNQIELSLAQRHKTFQIRNVHRSNQQRSQISNSLFRLPVATFGCKLLRNKWDINR